MKKLKIHRKKGKIVIHNPALANFSDKEIERIRKYTEFLIERKQKQTKKNKINKWWNKIVWCFYILNGKVEE